MKSKPLIVLITTVVILAITSVAALLFIQNIENFIYPSILPLNPNKIGVSSYGVSQKLYAVVDNIEETEQDGNTTRIVTLIPLPDEDKSYEDKKIEIIYDEQYWDNLPQVILYWNTGTSQWDEYSKKPENTEEGIDIADTVLIYNDRLKYAADRIDVPETESFARIIGVIKPAYE